MTAPGRARPSRAAALIRGRVDASASRRARPVRHPHAGGSPRPAGCVVITVSDTRGLRDDVGGSLAQERLERAGHRVVARSHVRDERAAIRRAVRAALARPDADLVVVTGGTGIARRDVTPEAVEPVYERALPGFGERFRALSAGQVGSAAWLSRASAGVARGRLIVVLPGSPRAVGLALDRLLLPELGHALRLLGRFEE